MDRGDELKDLYAQYGELVLKIELLQQKYVEIRNKIAKLLENK
jgi:hypothetical protein